MNEELPIGVLAAGPHIVAAAGHCIKEVSARARIGGYHLRPGAAIPVERQSPTGLAAGIIVHPYRQHVVAAPRSSVKVIVVRAWIRTLYQQPSASVPMYRQRPKGGCSKQVVMPHRPHVVVIAAGDDIKGVGIRIRIGAVHNSPEGQAGRRERWRDNLFDV